MTQTYIQYYHKQTKISPYLIKSQVTEGTIGESYRSFRKQTNADAITLLSTAELTLWSNRPRGTTSAGKIS